MGNVIMPEDLVAELPLERGDRVLVASDVTTLCWEALQQGKKFDLDRLIDLLQKKIGPEGTLLFPTYNWAFCITARQGREPVRSGRKHSSVRIFGGHSTQFILLQFGVKMRIL